MEKSTYFIGICPPDLLEQQIDRIKDEFRQKHGIQAAFRSKAHITLQMPFHLPTKRQDDFLIELKEYLKHQNSFEIKLNGFGKFEPRVVFINVSDNQRLNSLQKSIEHFMKRFQVFNSTHKNNGFNPHITIAFRDLKKPIFYKIWDEVSNRAFKESFMAESIIIFRHTGKSWDVFKELKLDSL